MNTKDLYNQLISQVLTENNVLSVICMDNAKAEPFFDRINVREDGSLEVYRHGLSMPLSGFFFDFTIDFARVLSYIEDEIFTQSRMGKMQHGYQVIFK